MGFLRKWQVEAKLWETRIIKERYEYELRYKSDYCTEDTLKQQQLK